MHENCDTCHVDYTITAKNTKVFLFLEDAEANHLEATCPNGHVEIIFLTVAGFFRIMSETKLNVTFGEAPTEEFKARAHAVWHGVKDELDDPERDVHIPREWLRQLYDDMRVFGGQA